MRISLDLDTADFAAQVGYVRENLQTLVGVAGQEGISSRVLLGLLPGFMYALRTELMSKEPNIRDHVYTAVADLIANIALITVETMADKPGPAHLPQIDHLLGAAWGVTQASINEDKRRSANRVDTGNGHRLLGETE